MWGIHEWVVDPRISNKQLWWIFCCLVWISCQTKSWVVSDLTCLNTLRPRQNGLHFADNIFRHIFFNENFWISIKISLTFVPKGPIYNIPALVQIMARRLPGDEPLSEPMMDSLPTHICVTRPQWVNADVTSLCIEFNWIWIMEWYDWQYEGHVPNCINIPLNMLLMCRNYMGISLMLLALEWSWPSSRILWHVSSTSMHLKDAVLRI